MLTPEKPLRADAQRTREALLDVARAAFAAGDVDIRIDEIARRAHVGVGTFYRHFDTRNAILEAVYRQQLRQLCDVAPKLLRSGSGAESLRSFLEEMMRYAERNRGMAAALGALARSGSPVFEVGRRDLLTSLDLILEAGRADRTIDGSARAESVLLAMSGACAARNLPQWEDVAAQVVDLVTRGCLSPAAR